MKKAPGRKLIITLIAAAVILIAATLVWAVSKANDNMADQTSSIRDTVRARALQCYVIEGAYPDDLSYLEEHYGLIINQKDYYIVYTPVAENIPPEVVVVYKQDTGKKQ